MIHLTQVFFFSFSHSWRTLTGGKLKNLFIFFSNSVENVTEKEQVKPRPLALNTVELMRAASAGLGLGPHNAMTLAERLYTQGYISYPRTETTSYPSNFDLM